MSGRGNWSGQTFRERRESLENAPGYNGNDFPDSGANHIQYDIGNLPYGDVDYDAAKRDVQKRFGVSEEDADRMVDGVAAFTGSPYSEIRDAQSKGDTTSWYGRMGKGAEDFIAAGVASGNGWNGGNTYRGIAVNDAAFDAITSMRSGSNIDIHLNGSASWATNVHTARDFASDNYGVRGNNHMLVFVNLDASQNGVSVARISSSGEYEQEVLCSRGNKYKKVGDYSEGDYTYIYVRNA